MCSGGETLLLSTLQLLERRMPGLLQPGLLQLALILPATVLMCVSLTHTQAEPDDEHI